MAQAKPDIMISTKHKAAPSFAEFVIIVSLITSLGALSIDAILPALPQIGSDLNVQNANDRQLTISLFILGMAVGQMVGGPLSDKTGRKPPAFWGYALFVVGSLLSLFAVSFPLLLSGRFLQGAGISASRTVTIALVRDRYEGREMARVMSFVMTVFILVPMLAPTFGQTLLLLWGWRSIFGFYVLFAVITVLWFGLRMPETLTSEERAPFSLRRIVVAIREIVGIRLALGYTVAAGLINGAFLGYLNSAQQIFQEQYALGELFPLYFAGAAFSIGLASLLNSRLVMRLGMSFLARWSLIAVGGLSVGALGISLLTAGQPPLWFLMAYLVTAFFCIGILFGNINALAMKPLGHIAGIGAAVIGALSTLISVPIGTAIGQSYNGTILPFVAGMVILVGLSIVVVRWADGGQDRVPSSIRVSGERGNPLDQG
jgi:DHA1 family bicyclomycin/chloramphenicol resistance-like MFS transporter